MSSQPLAGQTFAVDPGARTHILDGDGTGGGHRFGTGRGKTEFPQGWSDDDIIEAIEDVANDPGSVRSAGRYGREKVIGIRRGMLIVVIVEPATGRVVTGYPSR
jgi:hypothetical protein